MDIQASSSQQKALSKIAKAKWSAGGQLVQIAKAKLGTGKQLINIAKAKLELLGINLAIIALPMGGRFLGWQSLKALIRRNKAKVVSKKASIVSKRAKSCQL